MEADILLMKQKRLTDGDILNTLAVFYLILDVHNL